MAKRSKIVNDKWEDRKNKIKKLENEMMANKFIHFISCRFQYLVQTLMKTNQQQHEPSNFACYESLANIEILVIVLKPSEITTMNFRNSRTKGE